MKLSNLNGIQLLERALQVTQNVAYYLPRHTDLSDLLHLRTPFEVSIITNLAIHADAELIPMKVEKNYLNGKLKAITVYFGNLIQAHDL